MSDCKLYLGDVLDIMSEIPDKSIDLICTDPPYNIKKADWDKIPDYIEWCGKWLSESQRVLKDNGSMYFWHNDMQQIADLILWIRKNTRFVFKQFIVWNKRFEGVNNAGFLDGFIVPEGLRNYQQMAEYCLYYTFQDETGLTKVYENHDCFIGLRNYAQKIREYIGYSRQKMIDVLGNGRAQHFLEPFGPQWQLCTPETYQDLIDKFGIDKMDSFREYEDSFREYEDLRREYEDLRREYEDLRYTFNNQKTHHSVWNYEIAERNGHPTPKPVGMMENIILHSSNPGDVVLDMFMGSGATGEACMNTDRHFIGIDNNEQYFNITKRRIEQQQMRLPI